MQTCDMTKSRGYLLSMPVAAKVARWLRDHGFGMAAFKSGNGKMGRAGRLLIVAPYNEEG